MQTLPRVLTFAVCMAVATPAASAVYYVDFVHGNDSNSGTGAASAWKHAPGDAAAKGTPASIKLNPGDTVRFRAGVSYRGSIALKHGGAAGKPIIWSGMGWGSGRAIIDGADPVTSTINCPSKAACGNAANWQKLKLVTFTPPAIKEIVFYDQKGQLFLSQYPAAKEPFWNDNLDHMAVTPVGSVAAIESGRLTHRLLAAQAAKAGPGAQLMFWISGNQLALRKVQSVSGSNIHFTPDGLKLYRDRPGRVALLGSANAVTTPGSFAVIAPGKAVVYPRSGGGALMVGTGRAGIDLQGKSHIVIEGFHFARGTADRGWNAQGIGVDNTRSLWGYNWVIENNTFGPAVLGHGRGVISINYLDGAIIRNNEIDSIQVGSGVRVAGSVRNLQVLDNRMRRIARTAIYFGGIAGGTVRGNILHEMQGIHGNAMSFYLANQNITVENNCVFNSTRPITFHGDDKLTHNNLVFRKNILIGTPDSSSALTSWGSRTQGVTVVDNIALGAKFGIRLMEGDAGVTVRNNLVSGLNFPKPAPASWNVADNTTASFADHANMELAPDYCQAAHAGSMLKTGAR